ncbi:MAG: hypothetical protein HOE62_14730 [Alphaproteobacteria bacterium]|jgi:hypothetical protein|nr:hypothetical protein [Alphaproteobacteria bacterium]MBT6108631.1 hypothetical protein [Rhodospirillales bacterium]
MIIQNNDTTGNFWRDIENAPKDGTIFLGRTRYQAHLAVYCEGLEITGMEDQEPFYYVAFGTDTKHSDLYFGLDLTHWMPIQFDGAAQKIGGME